MKKKLPRAVAPSKPRRPPFTWETFAALLGEEASAIDPADPAMAEAFKVVAFAVKVAALHRNERGNDDRASLLLDAYEPKRRALSAALAETPEGGRIAGAHEEVERMVAIWHSDDRPELRTDDEFKKLFPDGFPPKTRAQALARYDERFAALDGAYIANVLTNTRPVVLTKDGSPKGGSGNRNAWDALARLTMRCGAFGVPKVEKSDGAEIVKRMLQKRAARARKP